MTIENFTRKTCYDYFQVYDITLICKNPTLQLHALLLKKAYRKYSKNCTKTMSYLQ
jgi:hypothetical protein